MDEGISLKASYALNCAGRCLNFSKFLTRSIWSYKGLLLCRSDTLSVYRVETNFSRIHKSFTSDNVFCCCYYTWFCLIIPLSSYSALRAYPQAEIGTESSKFSRGGNSNKFFVFCIAVIFPMPLLK